MNVDLCTRVEGDARIEYLMEKRELIAVNFVADVFRGFEAFLVGKRVDDVPRIASRICGLCHASQSLASSLAVEALAGTTNDRSLDALRDILLAGELVKSHATHFFFQGYPDIAGKIHGKTPGLDEIMGKDKHLAPGFFKIIKAGRDACEAIGGREIHPVLVATGPASRAPGTREIQTARRAFTTIVDLSGELLEEWIPAFSALEPPVDTNYRNTVHLSVTGDDTNPRRGTALTVTYPNGKRKTIDIARYQDLLRVEPGMRGYETGLEQGMSFITGPLARLVNHGEVPGLERVHAAPLADIAKTWMDNTFLLYLIQLAEIHAAATRAIKGIDALDLATTREHAWDGTAPPNAEGVGAIEAPRGTLLHHYHSQDGKTLSSVQLLIATKINMPLIDALLTSRCKELHDKGFGMDEIKQRAQVIVRTFDPCISCATHVIRAGS